MKMVGYLSATKDGFIGESGSCYDYILGSNGLFISTGNPLIEATICIAPAEVRGLIPVHSRVSLTHGKIPSRLYALALMVFVSEGDMERYLAIIWKDGGYHSAYSRQTGSGGSVEYEKIPGTIMDIHSHGGMGAFFSTIDDRDEQGLKLYMVVGKTNTLAPEHLIRLGIYGYFAELSFDEVFD